MMSRDECLSKADHCERMAQSRHDCIDRRVLQVTAEHWRTLAREARVLERATESRLAAPSRVTAED